MARRKRLAPGQTYGGGGGGIDIGSLLMGIYGGVELDPMFAAEDEIAEKPFDKPYQSDAPYKARSIFDRAGARQANAEYKVAQAEEGMASKRRLAEERGLNPILAERQGLTTTAEQKALLEAAQARRPFDLSTLQQNNDETIKLQRVLSAITNMVSKGLNPTVEAEGAYNSQINPEVIKALQLAQMAEQQKQRGLGLQNKIGADLTQATAEDTFRTGLATSKFGAKEAEGKLENFDRLQRNAMRLSDQAPLVQESQMVNDRLKTISPGASIVDAITGRMQYSAPDAMTKALQLSQSGGGNTPAQPPQVASEEDVVVINGKRYIRARQ